MRERSKRNRLWQWGRILVPLTVIVVIFGAHGKSTATTQAVQTATAAPLIAAKAYQNDYTLKSIEPPSGLDPLALSAKAAIIVDAQTGQVLLDQNAAATHPPASIAKLMTAIVAYDTFGNDTVLTIDSAVESVDGNKLLFKNGEKISSGELMHGMLMVSANDVAEVFAESFPGGRESFIKAMNEKAAQIGLKDSVFKNPSGLDDDGFVVSARDMATIARLIYRNYPDLLSIMGTLYYEIGQTPDHEYHAIYAISDLVKYKKDRGIIAVKNGFTSGADYTDVFVAHRGGRDIIVVFLASRSAFPDADKLLIWCDTNCAKVK